MPARRFFTLNTSIARLDAEEEARAITVTHHSKPGDRLKELMERIKGIEGSQPSTALVLKGEAAWEDDQGEIAAERERQKASAKAMMENKEQWLEQMRLQRDNPSSHVP
jgi:hypothetical protein